MLRDERLAEVAAGVTEPEETTAVPSYARIDWVTLVARLRRGVDQLLALLLASHGAKVHPYERNAGRFKPYRSTAELAGGLLVHFGPCMPYTSPVTIEFPGDALELGLASAVFRQVVAPLLVPSSVGCSRLDIAIDYAAPPIRFLPFGPTGAPTQTFRPSDKKQGYAWPALHRGSVPNIRIGKPRAAEQISIYDKTARVVDQFWQRARPWCQHHFEQRSVGTLTGPADLASASSSLRETRYAIWPITESVRKHERVTRVEARLRLRSTKARSPAGLLARVANPFAKLGFIDLLAVKRHNPPWYRVLLQARLVGLEPMLAELGGHGLTRAKARRRLQDFASLPLRGGLESPASVFERSRTALQRQLEDVIGSFADKRIEAEAQQADSWPLPVYLPQMPRPPMPPPRSPRTIPAGALLRDNRSRGARLVVVMAVEGDRVRGYDQRTGRRTSFQLGCVGPASARFTVVPPGKADEALRRMRDHRLRSLGTNVVHLAGHRSSSRYSHR